MEASEAQGIVLSRAAVYEQVGRLWLWRWMMQGADE